MMNRAGFPDDVPLESKMVTRGIRSAQSQVESRNFEIRKNVLKYDDVLSRQRSVIYDERRRVLEGEDLEEQVQHFIRDVITAYVDGATAEGQPEQWDLDALWTALRAVYPVSITPAEVVEQAGEIHHLTRDLILTEILSDAEYAYKAREEELGAENMRQLERRVTLSVLDRKWREHLYEMDYLKEGIGLRAMAQRDPLVEYQREGFTMFEGMMGQIKEESMGLLYNLEVKVRPAEGPQDHVHLEGGGLEDQQTPDQSELSYTAPDEDGAPAVSGAQGETDNAVPSTRGTGRGGPCVVSSCTRGSSGAMSICTAASVWLGNSMPKPI